jgi:putative ABC transport system substrate-binding protein
VLHFSVEIAPSFETAARSLKVELITAPIHGDVDIEAAIIGLGREPGGGLVVMPDIFTRAHRVPIILAVARNNVPAVYFLPTFGRDGGLLSYGPDVVDIFRRAASYVDRILRGAKPGDLPAVSDQVRGGRKPQDRQGARPYSAAIDLASG